MKQQQFLIVLDFEVTWWDSKHTSKTPHEIIEFAAVLLHIRTGKIISSFKYYVKPTEMPILSATCTSRTCIQQSTVDHAQTLETVLNNFDLWIKQQKGVHGFHFAADPTLTPGRCTLATWSDWDLGTCLKNECKRKRRKRLQRKPYFDQWIDVRKTYMDFYKNRAIGLNGALQSMIMGFPRRILKVGTHGYAGIDDATHTAYLINQMVKDGVCLAITK